MKPWSLLKFKPCVIEAQQALSPLHPFRYQKRHRPSAAALPPEIWACIASFLPIEQLRNLYSLNSIFYTLAMDSRYAKVQFPLGSQSAKRLLHLSNSHIAPRVKTLNFLVEFLYTDDDRTESMPGRMKQRIVGRLSRSPEHHCRKEQRQSYIADLAYATVHYFSNLTSFHINGIGFEFAPQQTRSFMKAAWSTFGTSLKELSIVADLGSFTEFLPPCSHLESLRIFRLRIDIVQAVSEAWHSANPGGGELQRFLVNVAPTLEALDLTCFPWHGPDLPKILDEIGQFPSLRSFSISTYDHSNPLSGSFNFAKFIDQHSSTLRHLDIPPHNLELPASQTFDEPKLGSLQSLVFTSQRSDHFHTTNFQAAHFYIQRWKDTLTSLELNMHFLKYSELTTLIGCFRPQSRLKNLTLAVRALSPDLFDLLGKHTMDLQNLTLLFYQICASQTGELSLRALRQIDVPPDFSDVAQLFLREMGKRDFNSWGIKELNLQASWHILETARGVSWKSLHSSILLLERRTRSLVISRPKK